MDELITLYGAEGLDCEAAEYPQNTADGGATAVWCSGTVGDSELHVEAKYGFDDELDRSNYVLLPVGYPDATAPSISQHNSERAMQVVVRIPYPAEDGEVAEASLIEALDDPDCFDRCMYGFEGGHWGLKRMGKGGWLVDLALDRPQR